MTKVLGFCADPSNARYAIVQHDGKKFALQNGATESKLVYPADIEDAPKKVLWLYRKHPAKAAGLPIDRGRRRSRDHAA